MSVVCIDFGTSSIRASLQVSSNIWPLAIAPNSSIDNASIPSVISLTKNKKLFSSDEVMVHFGEAALRNSLDKSNIYCNKSPKAWLFGDCAGSIDDYPLPGISLSKKDLIKGLVAFSAGKIYQQLKTLSAKTALVSKQIEFRITHPIWSGVAVNIAPKLYYELIGIISSKDFLPPDESMNVHDFKRWLSKNGKLVQDGHKNALDFTEPVAAAVELYKHSDSNKKSFVLLVDVGAGTIDFCFFKSVKPSSLASNHKNKFVSIGEPSSLYLAGNYIDVCLEKLASSSIGETNAIGLAVFKNDIRKNKEKLFKDEYVRLPGSSSVIKLDQFINLPQIREMSKEITTKVSEMLDEIYPYASLDNSNDYLIILSGGGANIGFIEQAVIDGYKQSKKIIFIPSAHKIEEPKNFNVDASLLRMAVSMGGAVDVQSWPSGRKSYY